MPRHLRVRCFPTLADDKDDGDVDDDDDDDDDVDDDPDAEWLK